MKQCLEVTRGRQTVGIKSLLKEVIQSFVSLLTGFANPFATLFSRLYVFDSLPLQSINCSLYFTVRQF